MLSRGAHQRRRHSSAGRARQQGMVLLMAIIVLVALTLASLALTRSVYTSNVIAGNLAFQRAATNSAEAGVESAVTWLESQNGKVGATCAGGKLVLDCHQKDGEGYLAAKEAEPAADQGWNEHWESSKLAAAAKLYTASDSAGNRVLYVIERMCQQQGDSQVVETGCTVSPNPGTGSCSGGSSCSVGSPNLSSALPVYYRITVRVEGPRNTRSLVQATVSL